MGNRKKAESCPELFFLKRETEQEDSCSSESSVKVHKKRKLNRSEKVPCPSPFQEQLRRVSSPKRVPTFSRKSANPISLSNMSRTFSTGRSGTSLGSKSKSRRQWVAALIPALANLVSSHNMKIEIVDEVIDVLNTEMKAMVFLNLHPDTQKMEVMRTIGSRAFTPVESPLDSTQLVEFTPSASNIYYC